MVNSIYVPREFETLEIVDIEMLIWMISFIDEV